MSNRKIVTLVDFFSGGHHPSYFLQIAKFWLDLDYDLYVIYPNPAKMAKSLTDYCLENKLERIILAENIVVPLKSTFPIVPLVTVMNNHNHFEEAQRVLESLRKKHKRKADFVFFCWLDTFIQPMAKIFSIYAKSALKYPWGGITFQMNYLLEMQPLLPKYYNSSLEMVKSKNCKSILTLVENVFPQMEIIDGKFIKHLPDFAEYHLPSNYLEVPIVKEIVKRANGRKIIAIVGSLAERKGVLTFLKLARKMDLKKYYFVLAGKLSNQFSPDNFVELVDILYNKQENLYFASTYLTDSEFDAIVKAVDLLYLAYEDFDYSSNLLTKAAQLSTKVVVTKDTLMAQRVLKYNTGQVIDPSDEAGALAVIVDEINRPDEYYEKGNLRYAHDFSLKKAFSIFAQLDEYLRNNLF